MKFDLKGMNRKQLERLRADVDKALARLAEAEKRAALKAAEAAARAHGYSLAEITGADLPSLKGEKRTGTRGKVAPKYRNPENPDETWSGRGRAPRWMQAHLAAGGSKEDLAI
ncbi:MAG: H-NS histone family protein [Alphaproteobacteria bacterium]|nr:MAG: H-NS histone family protein [Alphaproteobacteria bacterium]